MTRTLQKLFAISFILSSISAQTVLSEPNKSEFFPTFKQSDTRILKQPNGPFAVMLFKEDALGINIGVIYYDKMGNPADGNWWLSERFWSDRLWSSDVTNIFWGPSGKYLYVSTSRVYGNGSLFQLDLKNQSVEKLYPINDIKNTKILQTKISGFNDKTKQLIIRVTFEDNTIQDSIEIPIE